MMIERTESRLVRTGAHLDWDLRTLRHCNFSQSCREEVWMCQRKLQLVFGLKFVTKHNPSFSYTQLTPMLDGHSQ